MNFTLKQISPLVVLLACIGITLSCVTGYVVSTKVSMENSTSFYDNDVQNVNDLILGKSYPVITATNQHVRLNSDFNTKSWVRVNDAQDGDITAKVEVYGKIDKTKKGDYEIRYVVRNSYGLKTTKKIRVIVD